MAAAAASVTSSSSASQQQPQCSACSEVVEKVMRCAACNIPAYCSKDCQKADWKNHKIACYQAQMAINRQKIEIANARMKEIVDDHKAAASDPMFPANDQATMAAHAAKAAPTNEERRDHLVLAELTLARVDVRVENTQERLEETRRLTVECQQAMAKIQELAILIAKARAEQSQAAAK